MPAESWSETSTGFILPSIIFAVGWRRKFDNPMELSGLEKPFAIAEEQLQLGSCSVNQGRSDQMKIKTKITFFLAPIVLGAGAAFGADAAANWNQHCASCHGKDGSGSTTMGKKLSVKDYRDAKVQEAFSDGEAERAIKEGVKTSGKETMKPFGAKLSDADTKALVAYVRSFKK